MTLTTMALSEDTIKKSYPLPVYNYKVTILKYDYSGVLGIDQKVEEAAAAPNINFSEISGLSTEYDPVTYKHGFSYLTGSNIIPGMKQPIRLTMKRGIFKGDTYLYDWFKKSYIDLFFGRTKRDIVVDLCDENGEPVVRWIVKGALPIKLEAPTFDANSNEVAIETLDLIAQDVQLKNPPASS